MPWIFTKRGSQMLKVLKETVAKVEFSGVGEMGVVVSKPSQTYICHVWGLQNHVRQLYQQLHQMSHFQGSKWQTEECKWTASHLEQTQQHPLLSCKNKIELKNKKSYMHVTVAIKAIKLYIFGL